MVLYNIVTISTVVRLIGVSQINYRLSSSSDFFLPFVKIFSRYFLCVNAGIDWQDAALSHLFPMYQTLPLPSLHLSCIVSYDLRGGKLLGVCSTKRLYRRIKKVCTGCLHSCDEVSSHYCTPWSGETFSW